jgi:hypothetical protein
MAAAAAKVTRRLAYLPPAYKIDTVALSFQIFSGQTIVESVLTCRPNPGVPPTPAGFPPLVLHRGKDVAVKSVSIGGAAVTYSTPDGELQVPLTAEQGACSSSWRRMA